MDSSMALKEKGPWVVHPWPSSPLLGLRTHWVRAPKPKIVITEESETSIHSFCTLRYPVPIVKAVFTPGANTICRVLS